MEAIPIKRDGGGEPELGVLNPNGFMGKYPIMFIHVSQFQMECDIQMIMEIWIYMDPARLQPARGSASYRFLILEDEILDIQS